MVEQSHTPITLKEFTIDALVCHAIKAEIESREIYDMLSKLMKNERISERFTFFAIEARVSQTRSCRYRQA